MDLYLDGRAGGERLGNKLVVTISIRREQTLLEEIFTLDWEPRDIPFRRIAIREDASSGAFTDLIWDVCRLQILLKTTFIHRLLLESRLKGQSKR